jgi:hypothetical protein
VVLAAATSSDETTASIIIIKRLKRKQYRLHLLKPQKVQHDCH